MNKVNRKPRGLLPAEVASLFRVDPKTVTRWAQANLIPAEKTPGRHHRFTPEAVRKLLTEHYVNPELAQRLAELEKMLAPKS